MSDQRYNGWTNYETWNWKLWIDNDAGSYHYWQGAAREALADAEPLYDWEDKRAAAVRDLAVQLQEDCESQVEDWMPDQASAFADMLSGAIGRIEWREIAESLIDEADDDE